MNIPQQDAYVLHLSGYDKFTYKDILEKYSKIKIHVPDNIGIILPITDDQYSYVAQQINNKYYNWLKGKTIEKWTFPNKIYYIYESLKLVQEEYCLIMDGNDTVILKDLDNLIDDFNSYNEKIIFNTERMNEYKNKKKSWVINTGVCFGKTIDLLNFYKETWDEVDEEQRYSTEYAYVKRMYDKGKCTIDYNLKLFECITYCHLLKDKNFYKNNKEFFKKNKGEV